MNISFISQEKMMLDFAVIAYMIMYVRCSSPLFHSDRI